MFGLMKDRETIRCGPEPKRLLLKLGSPRLQLHDSQTSEAEATSHLFILGMQRDLEQSVCSLVQKVGVQHSDFTDVS